MPAAHLPPPPYRQTTLLGLLLLVLVGLFTWQSWRTDRDDQLQQLRTVAELAERATDRYFSQQQLALGELAARLRTEGGLNDAVSGHRLLLDFKNRHSELQGMHLLALDGRYLASSLTPDVQSLPVVTLQRNFASAVAGLRAEPPMVLARPLLGPLSQRWILPLRYAVRSPEGEPLALLVAAAPVELVQSFWSDAPVVRNAAVALLRDDGYLINRYPLPAGTSDDEVYGAPRTGAVVSHLRDNGYPRRGTVAGSSSLVPGDPHISVFVRLQHFPVTLSVTMSQRRMVLNWWERAAAPLLLIVTLAALGLMIFHRLGRRERTWALERLQAEQRRLELQQEQALRQRAEQQAQALDVLLAERSQMLDVLAHEVRQPLNNASAALQSASGALAEVAAGPVAHRLARAHAVLSQVTGSLDNTLAVATQLARPGPVQREDIDIDTLVAVSVGDLPAEQRSRIVVERQTATRTVLADLGLVRLALRNLLVNALRHGAAGKPVTVRLADSDEPLALIIDVIDQGPGIEPGLVPRLFERGVRGSASSGHGLGLFLVRRVMEQHGGRVVLLKNSPGEVVFRLVLEQTAGD